MSYEELTPNEQAQVTQEVYNMLLRGKLAKYIKTPKKNPLKKLDFKRTDEFKYPKKGFKIEFQFSEGEYIPRHSVIVKLRDVSKD